jgi:hypothetical protein
MTELVPFQMTRGAAILLCGSLEADARSIAEQGDEQYTAAARKRIGLLIWELEVAISWGLGRLAGIAPQWYSAKTPFRSNDNRQLCHREHLSQ